MKKFVPRCALLSIRTMYQNIYVKLISIKAINENIFTKLSHARSEKQMPFLPFQMFVTLEGFAIFIFVIRFSNLTGALARFRDTLLLLCHLSNVAKKVTISSSPAPRSAVASPPSFSFWIFNVNNVSSCLQLVILHLSKHGLEDIESNFIWYRLTAVDLYSLFSAVRNGEPPNPGLSNNSFVWANLLSPSLAGKTAHALLLSVAASRMVSGCL